MVPLLAIPDHCIVWIVLAVYIVEMSRRTQLLETSVRLKQLLYKNGYGYKNFIQKVLLTDSARRSILLDLENWV